MTFRIFYDNTTADASDTNDNYYHIGQGSRNPMGSSVLTPTTGVYDLGSDTYKWNNIYTDNIVNDYFDSNGMTWRFIAKSTINTATSRIEIDGLSGVTVDNRQEYLFKYMFITETSTATEIKLHFNAVSTGAYKTFFIDATDISLATGLTSVTTIDGILLFDPPAVTTTANYHYGHMEGRGSKNVSFRGNFIATESIGENRVKVNRMGGVIAAVSSITSLQVTSVGGNMGTDSYFEVWAKDV